jgi:hypothetical protein
LKTAAQQKHQQQQQWAIDVVGGSGGSNGSSIVVSRIGISSRASSRHISAAAVEAASWAFLLGRSGPQWRQR